MFRVIFFFPCKVRLSITMAGIQVLFSGVMAVMRRVGDRRWGDDLLGYTMEHRLRVGSNTRSIGVKSWLYHVQLCDFGKLT